MASGECGVGRKSGGKRDGVGEWSSADRGARRMDRLALKSVHFETLDGDCRAPHHTHRMLVKRQ